MLMIVNITVVYTYGNTHTTAHDRTMVAVIAQPARVLSFEGGGIKD